MSNTVLRVVLLLLLLFRLRRTEFYVFARMTTRGRAETLRNVSRVCPRHPRSSRRHIRVGLGSVYSQDLQTGQIRGEQRRRNDLQFRGGEDVTVTEKKNHIKTT